jgi:Pal1 cell morphology protein
MQAFPEGSLNMQLGGSGPLKKNIDLNQYHGTGQEAHFDYNEAAVVDEDSAYIRRAGPNRDNAFNALSRVEPLHGNESAGLGTSTFLEGAPASRVAIQRRESENEAAQQAQALSRKKSLAQRIRGTRSNTIGGQARNLSPPDDGAPFTPVTPLETSKSEANANPFFKDYDQEYEKKGQQIAIAEEKEKAEVNGRARAPSSPRRGLGLERTRTADSGGAGDEGKPESKASVFMNRVKSLKGGRRPRPDRRETSG